MRVESVQDQASRAQNVNGELKTADAALVDNACDVNFQGISSRQPLPARFR